MKTLVAAILVSLSMFAAADSHLLIFLGENNIEKLRPERHVLPDIQRSRDLRGDQIYWARIAERKLSLKDLDKASKGNRLRGYGHSGSKGRSGASDYNRILSAIRTEAPPKEVDNIILFWMQGETEAKEARGDTYTESVQNFVKVLEEDLDLGEITLVITRLSDYGLDKAQYPDWEKVRKAQEKLVKDNEGWELVDTDELNGSSNSLKFDSKGIEALGEMFTQIGLRLMTAE